MESKSEKFARIRDVRLPKAVKAISLLTNLASRDYEYTREDRAHLLGVLDAAVADVSEAFGMDVTPSIVVEDPKVGPYGGSEWAAANEALEKLVDGDTEGALQALRRALGN